MSLTGFITLLGFAVFLIIVVTVIVLLLRRRQ
jgi:hypothetical protein